MAIDGHHLRLVALGITQFGFIVAATSDIRWYISGAFNPGPQASNRKLHEMMAFPADVAREWMQAFHRTDQVLHLDELLYHAYAYSKGCPLDQPTPSDLSC